MKSGRAFLKTTIMLYKNWLKSLRKAINKMDFWQLHVQATSGDPDAKVLAKRRLETFVPPKRTYIGFDDQDIEL